MMINAPRKTNSPGIGRSLRTPAATAASLLVLATLSAGISAPAQAADTLSFQFTTVFDATAVGGSQVTPLHITYQFDPALAPGTGPIGDPGDGTSASYGPLQKMIVEAGDQCIAVSGNGTGITVFNSAGTSFPEDAYEVRADRPAVTGKTLYGLNLTGIRFLLIDNDATMFSSTDLPTATVFAGDADLQQTQIRLTTPDGSRENLFAPEDAPFQLTTYDPAGALAAIQSDLTGLQLNAGVRTSLENRLTKASGYISGTSSKSNTKAEQELRAFILQVEALRGKEIPAIDADNLINGATSLIDQLPACS